MQNKSCNQGRTVFTFFILCGSIKNCYGEAYRSFVRCCIYSNALSAAACMD